MIREIRGEKVILDVDLAALFGVTTGALNQAVRRNAERFPRDFMFQLSAPEAASLKSQIVISKSQESGDQEVPSNRSQNVTGSTGRGGTRKRPFAFTEHGALQAANVLKSERAVAMGVYVIRAFVQMRAQLTANAAIEQQLAAMERKLFEHDDALVIIWEKLKPLLATPPPLPPSPKRRIGF